MDFEISIINARPTMINVVVSTTGKTHQKPLVRLQEGGNSTNVSRRNDYTCCIDVELLNMLSFSGSVEPQHIDGGDIGRKDVEIAKLKCA